MSKVAIFLSALLGMMLPQAVLAEELFTKVTFYGIRYEMIIFALMLVGVAIFYNATRQVAIIGLLALCFFKYEFTDGFSVITKLFGFVNEQGEFVKGSWNTYFNLILMLPGFSVLADIFERSRFPSILPKYLPSNMLAGVVLLLFVFIISSFLDNIAAALIGCSLAAAVFGGKVHIGFAAAICAASNAGGAGSVVGDTTTTLIWIYGKDPLVLAHAFLPAFVAVVIVAFFAARAQHHYAPAVPAPTESIKVDKKALLSVFLILIFAIFFNYFLELPGVGIWLAILISMFFTKVKLQVVKTAYDSTVFLVALVFCAELVPIDAVPDASILSTMAIGFVSAVFNNIPLTQLCLIKGGYDWPLISYAVGFGGSMVWFGSSAGVAVCGVFPKARSFMNWLRYGWYIPLAFLIGFAVYLLVLGWDPMKGNPPDQMPEPVTYSEAIGNVQVGHDNGEAQANPQE